MLEPLPRQVFSPEVWILLLRSTISDLRSKLPSALTFSNFFLLGAYISGAGIGFKINQQLHGDRYRSLIFSVSPAKIKRSATDQEHQTHHNYRRFFIFGTLKDLLLKRTS